MLIGFILSYIILNSNYINGLKECGDSLNHAISSFILSETPETLIVYPTENYYYFLLPFCGKILKGNIKFDFFYNDSPPTVRLIYEDFRHINIPSNKSFEHYTWTEKDKSLQIREIDKNTYLISLKLPNSTIEKTVKFVEVPGRYNDVPENSEHIFNTIDESGFVFSLIFDTTLHNFIWLLNDSQIVNFSIERFSGPLYYEPISGFLFIKSTAGFILTGVPLLNVVKNNWWDGPFDQLNDRDWNPKMYLYMISIYSSIDTLLTPYLYQKNEVDKRISTANYLNYYDIDEVFQKLKQAFKSENSHCNNEENFDYLVSVTYKCASIILKDLLDLEKQSFKKGG